MKKGFFPLDATLNLPARKYSYLHEKWTQADIAEEPYDKVIARYAELLDIPVSKLGQENVTHESGNLFDAFNRQKPPFDPEIEGTCGSLVKDRMDRSGARWSKKGAQAVLNQRAVIKNGDMDDYWDFYMASEYERLYESSETLLDAA